MVTSQDMLEDDQVDSPLEQLPKNENFLQKSLQLITEDISLDMQTVIAMANESVTNQDIKSVKEPVIALVIVSDTEKGRKQGVHTLPEYIKHTS